jgi:hypothetical protein
MGIVFFYLFFICIFNIDYNILLYNLEYTIVLDCYFYITSSEDILTENRFIDYMYDPVKEAAANQNEASNSRGNSSQSQGGENNSGNPQAQKEKNYPDSSQSANGEITDTTRLADHLSKFKGSGIYTARIETYGEIVGRDILRDTIEYNRI